MSDGTNGTNDRDAIVGPEVEGWGYTFARVGREMTDDGNWSICHLVPPGFPDDCAIEDVLCGRARPGGYLPPYCWTTRYTHDPGPPARGWRRGSAEMCPDCADIYNELRGLWVIDPAALRDEAKAIVFEELGEVVG